EELDELRTADGEEGDARLARHRAREQRLPRPRRAHEQHAARHVAAESTEALRLAQEGDDLLEIALRRLEAGDVVEPDLDLRLLVEAPAAALEDPRQGASAHHRL